ncbi:MAG: TIGR01841 family phasin [Pseudomonadota bacterium]
MSTDDKDDTTGPFFEAFRSFGKNLSLPMPTVEDVMQHNRRNIAAMEKMAKNTTESATAIMNQQRKALENALADVTHMVQDARDGGLNKENARDIISDQVEFTRRSFETTIKNATEMGEILSQTGKDNMMVLKDRMQEQIEEIKTVMDRKKGD